MSISSKQNLKGAVSGGARLSGSVAVTSIIQTGVDPEIVKGYVDEYLSAFEIDDTLILNDNVLRVNTTDAAEKDNTLPISSAGVYTTVGNINALLETI